MSAAAPAPLARPGRSAMLGEVLRRCETTPCAGLRVEAPGVRAIAAAWLEEAANVGGGLLWRPRDGGEAGDIWLLGCTLGPCRRAMELLHGMGWTAALLEFPRDMPGLEAALAAEADAAPALPNTGAGATAGVAGGLEERVARLPPEAGHVLATVWRMGAAGPALLAQRWMPEPAALPAPPGADWAGHAAGLLAQRLLSRAALGQWPAQRKANLPLLLDLPWMPPPATLPAPPPATLPAPPPATLPAPPSPADGAGHRLVLPLASLPDAAAWASLAAAHGWALAWSGLTPCLAHLLDGLPGGFVFAAATGETAAAMAAWPPSRRLVLGGWADRAALAQAMAGGFALCSPLGE